MRVSQEQTSEGRLFQIAGAAERKLRAPNEMLQRVTDRRLAEADRRVLHGVCHWTRLARLANPPTNRLRCACACSALVDFVGDVDVALARTSCATDVNVHRVAATVPRPLAETETRARVVETRPVHRFHPSRPTARRCSSIP